MLVGGGQEAGETWQKLLRLDVIGIQGEMLGICNILGEIEEGNMFRDM